MRGSDDKREHHKCSRRRGQLLDQDLWVLVAPFMCLCRVPVLSLIHSCRNRAGCWAKCAEVGTTATLTSSLRALHPLAVAFLPWGPCLRWHLRRAMLRTLEGQETSCLWPLEGETCMLTCLRPWFCDVMDVWSNIKPGRCSWGPSFHMTSQGERMPSMLGTKRDGRGKAGVVFIMLKKL